MYAGIGLRRIAGRSFDTAISCGLAGGLRSQIKTGTIVIPRTVRRLDGTLQSCDSGLCAALHAAARTLGHEASDEPIYTSATLVRGAQRADLAREGYIAADMESGAIHAKRFACVRVVLDTPERELSGAWLTPLRALLQPAAWPDLPFLATEGPRCAALAARIVSRALLLGQ